MGELSELRSGDGLRVIRDGVEYEVEVEVLAGYVGRYFGVGELLSEGNASGVEVGAEGVLLFGWTGAGVSRQVICDEVGGVLTAMVSGEYRASWLVSGDGGEVEIGIGLAVNGEVWNSGYKVSDGIWYDFGIVSLNAGDEVSLQVEGSVAGTFTMESGRLELLRI